MSDYFLLKYNHMSPPLLPYYWEPARQPLHWHCPDPRPPIMDLTNQSHWFMPAPAVDARRNARHLIVTPKGETAAEWVDPTSLTAVRELEAYGMNGVFARYGAKPLDRRIKAMQTVWVPARPDKSHPVPPPMDPRTMTPITLFPYRACLGAHVVMDTLPLP